MGKETLLEKGSEALVRASRVFRYSLRRKDRLAPDLLMPSNLRMMESMKVL